MDGQYLPDDEIDIDSLASSEPPEYVPQMFSEGGEVEEENIDHYAKGGEASLDSQTEAMNKYLLGEDEDAMPMAYATTPTAPTESDAPEMSMQTAKSMLKKLAKGTGKSTRPKGMGMEIPGLSPAIPELGAPQTEQEKLTQIATARAQYDALERAYKLKAQAAQRAGRGLMKPTFSTQAFDQPTLEKQGPLMARTFAKGGEADKKDQGPEMTGINRVTDFIAQRLPASSFPTSGRTFLETVQGKRDPITEGNFSPEELAVMKEMIALKGGDAGDIQYGDYQALAKAMRARGKIPASTTPSLFSMSDPLGNVQTTLGRFKYGRDARGNLVVRDTYDFNPPQDPNSMQEQRTAEYGAMGPYSLIREYAGEKVPPGRGRDININLGKPVKRADGSPPSGERLTPQQIEQLAADQVALNQYYAAKARPSTGMNRQKGPISKQLDTGEAYVNMAKGVTEFPYDLIGAPVDIATMLMRPFGYSTEKPVMGSDWIKEKMTQAGVRPEPPADPTAKGFYTAGELLSNLTNPAGVSRKVGPVVEKGVTAVGKEAARQVERGMFNEGPLRAITPQPAFAVRPEGGGTTFTNVREGGSSAPISKLDKMIEGGANPRIEGLSNEMGDAIENFWRTKAQNYFTRQYGTPNDPIFKQIISGQLSTPTLQRSIPDYAIEQTKVGKTRIDPVTGESRFYPKYPQALEDLTRRYDELTGLKGIAFNVNEPIFDPAYPTTMGTRGTQLESALRESVTDKMVAGGMDPRLINTDISLTGPKGGSASELLNYVPGQYKELYSLYTNPPKDEGMLKRIYSELGLSNKPNEPVPNVVPENLRRAIQTSEPIYDVDMGYRSPLRDLFSPDNINRYLATLSPSDISKMRFEDVVKNSARYNLDMFNTQNLVDAIRSGKRVPDKVWKQGLSEPLMSFQKEGAKEGEKFTWHRIMDNEATAVEGAYLGHSVGGYAKGGSYGPKEYRRFKEGEKEVYTLRDPRGKPFTTIEIEKAYTGPLDRTLDERDIARMKAEGRDLGPVKTIVRQIKGNGAKTGNVAPKDVDEEVLSFLRDYIKPDKITESDSFLTPKLEEFKMDLSGRPRP